MSNDKSINNRKLTMKVLFITMYTVKDLEEKGIYQDLIRSFLKKKHNVLVISPSSTDEEQIDYGENYINAQINLGHYQKQKYLKKVLSMTLFQKRILNWLKKHNQHNHQVFNLLVYTTPPINYHKIVRKLKKKNPNLVSYLLLKDIFPQNAVDLGIIPNSLIYKPILKYYEHLEKKLYNSADQIGCMSQKNMDYLNHHFKLNDKCEINPNSLEIKPFHKMNETRRTRLKSIHKIPTDKVLFLYGGNIGLPQDASFIKNFIQAFSNLTNSFLLIIGSGTEFLSIQNYVTENDMNNVRVLNALSKDAYQEMVSISDVGLIFLNHRFSIPNFPSRILDYMEYALPILAATDPHTDIRNLIVDEDLGDWSLSVHPEAFIEKVKIYSENPSLRLRQGKNARLVFEEKFNVENSYQLIINALQRSQNVQR